MIRSLNRTHEFPPTFTLLPGFHQFRMAGWAFLAGTVVVISGCDFLPKGEAQTQPPGATADQEAPAVDVAIAQSDAIRQPREYTGTTQPIQEVSVRSQVEGQLLSLNVNVGDPVTQGQTLAQVDDSILNSAVVEAQAELASRQSEVARLQTQVSDARTQVEQARLQLQQAERDAARFNQLAQEGAIPQQQAEQSRTDAKTAAQVLRSAQEQVTSRQREVSSAQSRVAAQQAVINQAQERRSYAVLKSPLAGYVLAKTSEAGNLVQPGTELLKLGDFSRAKIVVQVSELELANVRVGQSVQVRLDAVPNRTFAGTVERITPAANPTSRLLPVEIVVPNPSSQNGSGLLARVNFELGDRNKVVVPLSALQDDRARGGAQRSAQGTASSNQSRPSSSSASSANRSANAARKTQGTLFVVSGDREQSTVTARAVTLGEQADGRVEILAGLRPGERFVVRSGKPLKDGDTVRLSVLSEQS